MIFGSGLSSSGIAHVVRRALSWWLRNLEAALPAWLVELVAGDRRVILISVSPTDDITVELRRSLRGVVLAQDACPAGCHVDTIGTLSLARFAKTHPVILICDTSAVMERTVSLPSEVLSDLATAVHYGLSTWTPFERNEVFFSAVPQERRGEQVEVRLRLVLRKTVEERFDRLAGRLPRPSHILLGMDDDPISVENSGRGRLRRDGRIDLALAVLASCMVLMIGVLAWQKESSARSAAEIRLRAEIELAKRQDELRARIAEHEAQSAFLSSRRQDRHLISRAMAELAGHLPEDADIRDFSWSRGRGQVTLTATEDPGAAIAKSQLFTVSRIDARAGSDPGRLVYAVELVARARRP